VNVIKQTAIEAIKRLPDGCSLEDIMYQIYFISQVFEGLRDAEEGRTVSSEELLSRIEQWAK
jgi:predicted transcriptional regulator